MCDMTSFATEAQSRGQNAKHPSLPHHWWVWGEQVGSGKALGREKREARAEQEACLERGVLGGRSGLQEGMRKHQFSEWRHRTSDASV